MFPTPAAATIAHSQRRETNSPQPSTSSRKTLGVSTERAREGRCIAARTAALSRYVAASSSSAQPGLAAATSTPPSAAPSTLVAFRLMPRSAFACCSRLTGTVCGTRPCEAGKKNEKAAPRKTWSAIRCQSLALPVRSNTAIAPCAAALIAFEPTITRCRGSRSAKTPPKRTSTSCGAQLAASTIPRSVVDPVRSRTAKASAIGATAVPSSETSCPVNSSRNSCSARGPSLRGRSLHLPVPLQPGVGLPERHRLLVEANRLAVPGELLLGRRHEGGLVDAAADARRPLLEPDAQLAQMALGVLGDAEVDQREPLRCPAVDLADGRFPPGHVGLGRGRRREDRPARLDSYPGGVARVQRAVAVEVADVVRGVAGRWEALEPDHLRSGRVDVRLRHRRQLTPELVERVAVEPPGAPLQAGRIDEMWGADLRDVHLQPRVLAHEHAGRARVVEVDVREQQVAQVGELEAALPQAFFQPRHAGGGAAVEERRPIRRLEQVAPDHPLDAAMHEVERLGLHGADASEGAGEPAPSLAAAYVRRLRATSAAPPASSRATGAPTRKARLLPEDEAFGALAGRPSCTSACFSASPPRNQPPRVVKTKIFWPGFM